MNPLLLTDHELLELLRALAFAHADLPLAAMETYLVDCTANEVGAEVWSSPRAGTTVKSLATALIEAMQEPTISMRELREQGGTAFQRVPIDDPDALDRWLES